MNEIEFKRLEIEKQVQIANKRCAELNGKKLTENFRCENLQIDYQTVAKILNKQNYTLFRGKFYKVLIDDKEPAEKKLSVPEEADMFNLVKKALSMKNTKSTYFKITDELLDEWNAFRNEKFNYVSSGALIIIAMLDFMKKHR